MHGQPIRPNNNLLITHLGVLVRMRVPIIYDNWKNVPVGYKQEIWDDLLVTYTE